MNVTNTSIRGVGYLVLALLTFSLQDVAVKWIGGSYPIAEIVLFRSLIALPCALLLVRFEGRRGLPTTRQAVLEYLRGILLFFSFTSYMMGLAALPLADCAAIRLSAPLMITALSVLFLGEQVGPRRWFALIAGFCGVLLIVQPGAAGFNIGSLFVLITAFTYALAVLITRRLSTTDSSATMAYYSSLVYLLASVVLVPLTITVGETNAHPSIAFLFRAWATPSLLDLAIMAGLGLVWAGGMYLIARAYSLAQASLVAPFEYTALLINVMWGLVLWQELPVWTTWIGAALTMLSGLYILYRERQERATAARASAATAERTF